MKRIGVVLLFLAFAVGACSFPAPGPTTTPEPTTLSLSTSTATGISVVVVSPAPTETPLPSPTATPTDSVEPTASPTHTPVPPTFTATPEPFSARVEPTFTPSPGDERARVSELPLGQPGYYVNVTFGYWVRYPADWHTGFGNRPLLVSFSDLDPGTHNRNSLRAEGCLIEINAATNIWGYTFEGLMSQLPRSFPDSQQFELDGQAAVRVRKSSGENPFDSEEVYAEHDHRLFQIRLDYAREAGDRCRPVWEDLLSQWQWFTPQFAVYRNQDYGYAISYPRSWYRFNVEPRGISISDLDPTGTTSLQAFLSGAMLVETTVLDNPRGLPLKTWLAAQAWQPDLTSDIPLDGILGVRVLAEGPAPGIEEMSGCFQGPLGKIYAVTCQYPAERQDEFRPIANAIIYSFEF